MRTRVLSLMVKIFLRNRVLWAMKFHEMNLVIKTVTHNEIPYVIAMNYFLTLLLSTNFDTLLDWLGSWWSLFKIQGENKGRQIHRNFFILSIFYLSTHWTHICIFAFLLIIMDKVSLFYSKANPPTVILTLCLLIYLRTSFLKLALFLLF